MGAIFQVIFLDAISWMKMYEFRLRFHWSLFMRVHPINNIPALFQIKACRRPGDKSLSEPMMVSLLTYICVTRPQWVNLDTPLKSGHVWVITSLTKQRMWLHVHALISVKQCEQKEPQILIISDDQNDVIQNGRREFPKYRGTSSIDTLF